MQLKSKGGCQHHVQANLWHDLHYQNVNQIFLP